MLSHLHYIVKQEITKEVVLPFGLFLQRNFNLISKIFPKKTEGPPPASAIQVPPEEQSADPSNRKIPGQSPFEPIPLPALFLHCFFTWVLIFSTWGINPPKNAYPLLIGEYLFRKYILNNDEKY